ncbi:MAG TPA: hypothetical protein VN688_33395 [Gemmataceae bacterium]|nr:hypothetical protein [Gemmataceae bacterium]
MTFDSNNTNTVYAAYVSYVWDYGIEGTPIAGPPGTPCEVISDHAPTCWKIVNWCVQSYDGNPLPLDPDTGTSNEVVKLKAIGAPFKSEMVDGTPVMTIAGTYVYIVLVPPSDTDPLVIGTPPYDPSLWTVINPSDFVKALAGAQVTLGGLGATYGGQQ